MYYVYSMFMFMLAALLRLAPLLRAAVRLNTPSLERGHGAHIGSGNMVTLCSHIILQPQVSVNSRSPLWGCRNRALTAAINTHVMMFFSRHIPCFHHKSCPNTRRLAQGSQMREIVVEDRALLNTSGHLHMNGNMLRPRHTSGHGPVGQWHKSTLGEILLFPLSVSPRHHQRQP
jgi:hypothetical protein